MSLQKTSLAFIGHVVRYDGTQLDPKKIKVVIDFLIPTIITNVCAFLGLT